MTRSTFDEITTKSPHKPLTEKMVRSAGRNAQGKLTVRHQGAGHKRLYRIIDWKRDKAGVPARIATVEYDPNRSARIGLLHYADGEKRYMLLPHGLGVGDIVASGSDVEARTGCVVVVGGTSIVADPGASVRLAPDDLPATLEAGAVLVSGYSLLQPGPEAAARAALERARTDCLAVDVASSRLVETFGVERFFEATATAGVLLANAEEARALTGLEAEAAARALALRYRVVCVKLGPAGAISASGKDVVRVEVQPVDRIDTLGAGDAFAGGFLVSLARGAALAVAVRAGCDSATAALLGQ
jgi:hypothetical protein